MALGEIDERWVTSWRMDAKDLREKVAEESIDCIVTSPPYNVGVQYPEYSDDLTWPAYRMMVRQVCGAMFDVAKPGCRVWVNVQPTVPEVVGEPSKGRVSLSRIWHSGLSNAGFSYRDEIAWVQDSFDGGCAWGSWLKPSAPNLRGSHEVVLLYYKGEEWNIPKARGWKTVARAKANEYQDPNGNGDWTELVRNVWTMTPANSRHDPYPARFPLELPKRCIRLSTWPGDIVLDPFAGSGTTGVAAQELERYAILIDKGKIIGQPGEERMS